MKFCSNCGNQIDDNAVICVKCGCPVDGANLNNAMPTKTVAADDGKSGGFAFLCFLFPVLGLILYIIWKDERPLKAKSCAKGAIIGVVIEVVFAIIFSVLAALGTFAFLAYADSPEFNYNFARICSIIH